MIHMSLSKAANSIQAVLEGDDLDFTGCTTDSRRVNSGELFIALRGEHFDGHEFVGEARNNGAVAAVVERNISGGSRLPIIIVDDSRVAMGKLAAYWRSSISVPLIAITGSNGKTTVKEMITSVLSRKAPVLSTRGNLNNEIGVPLTLFALDKHYQYAVIEMGANHPGEIAALTRIARPNVAAITQCAPAHLEGFGSVAGVASAKAEIFEGLEQDGIAIVNIDDSHAPVWQSKARLFRQISFSVRQKADVHASGIDFDSDSGAGRFTLHVGGEETEVRLSLPGKHNIQNALAAAACCVAVEIDLETIKAGLEGVRTIKGRLQIKKGINGSRVYDDTYNANPASLEAALKVVGERPGRHWLVLGDMGELGESSETLHFRAGENARAYGFEKLYTLGQLSTHAVEGFGNGALSVTSPEELVSILKDGLSEEINVLVKGSRAMAMERVVNGIVEAS